MKYVILFLTLFALGCEVPPQRVVIVRRGVQVVTEPVDELESLKKEYKENWQKETESEEGWIKARRKKDELAIKILNAKTAEESFEYAKELAEISPVEKKLWEDWKNAISKRYELIERMAKLSK